MRPRRVASIDARTGRLDKKGRSCENRGETETEPQREATMNLPGLVTVQADQTEELDALARMVGTCFLEEMG